MKFRLFNHGPAAGPATAHGDFESVDAAEAFLARPDNSPFEEGSQLYLVNEDNNQLWAIDEKGLEHAGIEVFYDATNEPWATEQIELLRRTQ